ncbi:hypothetical protein MA16_Dca007256 [Dendrobium catenatum]|uniref:Uncharacterized protein n=1 Tax=Dendrobium catenatum TaxID=906689 RepID=A0A2I0W6G9_9ASPA|nr:hypothetical protein MA16_Dca007256 [Dendrobium catenatum]
MRLEDHKESRGEYATSNSKDMRRELSLKYRSSTSDQPSGFKFKSSHVHQTFGCCTFKIATPSDHHLEHNPISFIGITRRQYYGRDHLSFSNIRVAAPPSRSSPSLHGRPSIGSSVRSVPYDSPLGPTPGPPSQSLASPTIDPASMILINNCIKKKKFTEPKTEYIHFVDTNDNQDFFEDETEVIESDFRHDLNPELGKLKPLNFETLAHPDPSLLEDNPLDKVCLDDNSKDSDLIISPTEMILSNYDSILENSNGDMGNLEFEVSQLNLSPNIIKLEPIDLKVMTIPDPIENICMHLEDSDLAFSGSEPNWRIEHPRVLLESILGVAPLELHLKECDFLDWTYLTTPRTDLNVRGSLSPYFHVTTLTVVPPSVMNTLPNFLSLIPDGDSLGYPIMVMNQDPSSYLISDSFILPAMFLFFPVKYHLSHSWMNSLDDPVAPRRLSTTITETSNRNVLVAKDVFIVPPTPVPLDLNTLDPLIS